MTHVAHFLFGGSRGDGRGKRNTRDSIESNETDAVTHRSNNQTSLKLSTLPLQNKYFILFIYIPTDCDLYFKIDVV